MVTYVYSEDSAQPVKPSLFVRRRCRIPLAPPRGESEELNRTARKWGPSITDNAVATALQK